MQRTKAPFRADEVGSLLRPPRIKEARAKLEKGEISAADLDALLEYFQPESPAYVVGHSMGGNVANLYAGIRPERVGKLVLAEGFGLPPAKPEKAPERYARWLDECRQPPTLRPYSTFAEVVQRLKTNNPRITDERAAFLAEMQAVGEWPQRPRLIGVANGVATGTGTDVRPGELALEGKGLSVVGTKLYTQLIGGTTPTDALNNAITVNTIDTPPQVNAATKTALSDVLGGANADDFWGAFK